MGGKKMAYAFYVTSAQYACGARVVMHQLKALGAKAGFLVVYLQNSISQQLVETMEAEGMDVRPVHGLPFVTKSYYHDALVKLRTFQQFDYERLLFMDADTYARGNLDHLFSVRLEGPELIAAPWKYYNAPHYKRFMPWLMLIEPRSEIWNDIETKFLNDRASQELREKVGDNADGMVLNLEFVGERSLKIPPQFAILNTEWCKTNDGQEEPDAYHYFTSREAEPLDRGMVHFSCWGKPWGHPYSALESEAGRIEEPLYSMYEDWYHIAREIGCYMK